MSFARPKEKTKPETPQEALEKAGEDEVSLEELSERAEALEVEEGGDDELIAKLEGTLSTAEQKMGLDAMEARLLILFEELKGLGEDISIFKDNPQKISELIERNQEKLKEKMGENQLRKLNEANIKLQQLLHEKGTTGEHVRNVRFWNDMLKETDSIEANPIEKYKEYYKESPVTTVAGTLAVAVGIGLTVKWLFSSSKKDGQESSGGGSTFKKILGLGALVGLPVLAYYKGGDMLSWLKDILKEKAVTEGAKTAQEAAEKVRQALPSNEAIEAAKKSIEEGVPLPEEYRKEFEKTEAGKAALKKIEEESGQIPEAPSESEAESEKGIVEISQSNMETSMRYAATAQALIALSLLEGEKNVTLEQELNAAFTAFSAQSIKTLKVVSAYKAAKEKGESKLDFDELGMGKNEDISPESLFVAAGMVSKALDYHNKHFPGTVDETMTIQEFLLNLGKDPALSVVSRVQNSMEERFKDFDITDVGDLIGSPGKFLEGNEIQEVIDEKKAIFIEHLAEKYKIHLSEMSEVEKNEFTRIIGEIYGKGKLPGGERRLNSSTKSIQEVARSLGASEKVQTEVATFWEELKKDTKPILDDSIKRYDIHRNDEKFDQMLAKNLKFEELSFNEGLELALLSDGIQFKTPMEAEGVGQMKEVAMVYLMANILKNHNEEAYEHYASNVIDISTSNSPELKLNPNFKILSPYFDKLFGVLAKKTSEVARKWDTMITGLSSLDKDPDKIGTIAQMDTGDFMIATAKEGIKGGYMIPKELVATVTENVPDILQLPTTGEDFLKMITALGGFIVYSKDGDTDMGIIFLGADYFVFKPVGIGLDTMQALVTEGPGTAIKTYLIDTAPYVAIGAAAGFARGAVLKQVSVAGGILSGVSRGLTAPASLPVAGYRTLRGAGRYAELLSNWREFGSGNTASLEMSARLFKEYSSKAISETERLSDQYESVAKAKGLDRVKEFELQARRRIYQDIYEQARIRWAKNFIHQYNNFFGFDVSKSEAGALKPQSKQIIDASYVQKAEKMEQFIQKVYQTWDLQNLDEAGIASKIDEAQTQGLLDDTEVKKLKEKLSKDVAEFKKSLSAYSEKQQGKIGTEIPTLKGPVEKLTTPIELKDGRYLYMGEVFTLNNADKAEIDAQTDPAARQTKLKEILEREWSTPKEISQGSAGKLYRYRGGTFVISDADKTLHGTTEAAIEAKYAESLKITDTRFVEGQMEYKIGREWVRPAIGPDMENAARKNFVEAAKKAGITLEHVDLSNTRVLKYFPILEKMMGPAIAAAMIIHLETAQDKKLAVAETAVGLATFTGGAALGGKVGGMAAKRILELLPEKNITALATKKILMLAGGIAAAYGFTEPIATILEEAIPKFTGDQQFFNEMGGLVETMGVAHSAHMGLDALKNPKSLEYLGKKAPALATLIEKRISLSFGPKIAKFAGNGFVKKVFASAGIKLGAVAVGEAVPVLNMVINVGMGAWMAKDIYDMYSLYQKSTKIDHAMKQLGGKKILDFQGADAASQKYIDEAMTLMGTDQESMLEKDPMAFLRSMPDVRIKIRREGSNDYNEEYRFVKGEILAAKITLTSGETLELTDEELNQEMKFPLPENFKPRDIDYNLPSEQLKALLEFEFLRTKSECEWTKLDHETISNDHEVLIKRLDGNGQTKITRSGNTWSVEGFSEGVSFYQAIVLANLKNKAQNIIEKEGYVGGSSRPFSIEGKNIDFDRSWNPTDLRILSEDAASFFYEKIDLNQRMIVDTLNNWYQAEGQTLKVAA